MRKARMTAILSDQLKPAHIQLEDQSEQHRGHGGWREQGETHFQLTIAAEALEGLTRVAQHRLINGLLTNEFSSGLHALSIRVVKCHDTA